MSATRTAPSTRRVVILGGMASYLDGATIVSVGVSILLFNSAFHFSPWMITAIVSGFALAFAVGAMIGGRLGDVIGRRAVYAVDLIIVAIALLGVVLAPNATMLLIAVYVVGLALGADIPTSMALVFEEASAGKRGSAVALSQTLWLSGVVVTQIIALFVANMGVTGARIVFLHPLIVAVVVWWMRRGIKESPAWEQANARKGASKNQNFRAIFNRKYVPALVVTAAFFVFGSASATIPGQYSTYLITTISGASNTLATVLALTGTLVGVVCAAIFQRIVDGKYRTAFFVAGVIVVVLGCAAAVLTGFALWAVAAWLIGTAVGGTWSGEGLYKVWTQEIFPTSIRSTAQGFTFGVGRFAQSAYGLAIPLIAATGAASLMWLIAAAMVVALLIGLFAIPRLPRAESVTRALAVPRGQKNHNLENESAV